MNFLIIYLAKTKFKIFNLFIFEMSTISHAAYLSELYNLRNMIKAHAIELNEIEIKILELQQKTPEPYKVIDIWNEGSEVHDKAYSADVVYQKITEVIKKIEDIDAKTDQKLDELIEKVDSQTELLNNQKTTLDEHTKKLNSIANTTNEISVLIENSVLPSLSRIEEKIDNCTKYEKSIILNISDVKSLASSTNTQVLNTYKVAEANFSKLSSLTTTSDSINRTVQEILAIIKSKFN